MTVTGLPASELTSSHLRCERNVSHAELLCPGAVVAVPEVKEVAVAPDANAVFAEEKEEQLLLLAALRRALPVPPHQAKLLAMLQTIDERLTSAGIPYWVTGGTLLGALRHGGLIPHDDDVDLELRASDLPRAQEALGSVGRSFRGLGFWPGSSVPCGRFFFWGRDGRFTESVDVFLREDDPLEEMAEFPSAAEVFPLRRVPFHNLSVPAPHGAASFLSRCYGPRWREEAVVWSHGSRNRELLRVPLDSYRQGVTEAGYMPPAAQATSEASLAAVDLESAGELREILGASLGWASPYGLDFDRGGEEAALSLLGLEERRFHVHADLAQNMVCLRERLVTTGASVEIMASSDKLVASAELIVVGDADEIALVEAMLANEERRIITEVLS